MYRIRILILLAYCLVLLLACTPQKDCDSPFIKLISKKIQENAGYDSSHKRFEILKKTDLLNNICSQLDGKKRIITIENTNINPRDYYGIIYIYDNQEAYSYRNYKDKIEISKGYKYDQYQGLQKFLNLIKDTVGGQYPQAEEYKRKSMLMDIRPTTVFYVDLDKDIVKFYLY